MSREREIEVVVDKIMELIFTGYQNPRALANYADSAPREHGEVVKATAEHTNDQDT